MDPAVLKQIMVALKELHKFDSCSYKYQTFGKFKLQVMLCGTKVGVIDIAHFNKNDIINNTEKWKEYISKFIITTSNIKCNIPEHNVSKITIHPQLNELAKQEPQKVTTIEISYYGISDSIDNSSSKLIGKYDGENCLITSSGTINVWHVNGNKWIPLKPRPPFYYYDIPNKKIWNITKYKNVVQALSFVMEDNTVITDKFTRYQYKALNNKWLLITDSVESTITDETVVKEPTLESALEHIDELNIINTQHNEPTVKITINDPPSEQPLVTIEPIEQISQIVTIEPIEPVESVEPVVSESVEPVEPVVSESVEPVEPVEPVVSEPVIPVINDTVGVSSQEVIKILDASGNEVVVDIMDRDKLIDILDPVVTETSDNYTATENV